MIVFNGVIVSSLTLGTRSAQVRLGFSRGRVTMIRETALRLASSL